MKTRNKNLVIETPTHPAPEAHAHFAAKFAHETDCWDVHATQDLDPRGFVLLDVRSEDAFQRGHLPGALHLPHWNIKAEALAEYQGDTLFVVYCAGPHCNGSTRAALRISALGRPVKEMIGGVTGWLDEGFALEHG